MISHSSVDVLTISLCLKILFKSYFTFERVHCIELYIVYFLFVAVPPYVPTISSIDDTSNFDEFESESGGPRIEDFMREREGFNGKNLPFIGFTFTRQLNANLLSEGYD